MQRTIIAFIGSGIVAVLIVIGFFFSRSRGGRPMPMDDAGLVIVRTIEAISSADIGNAIPAFNDMASQPAYNDAAQKYFQSAEGLTRGASTFAGLSGSANVQVASAAAAGSRIFLEIAAGDRQADERLRALVNGLARRDDSLDWFYGWERRRAEVWNTVGRDVTKPIADAVIIPNANRPLPVLRLTKGQLQQVRLAFANAAATTGGGNTVPAKLIEDLYWRLFGLEMFR